jgi:hypothetical protein
MRFKSTILRFCFFGSLLASSAVCGGWKWGV